MNKVTRSKRGKSARSNKSSDPVGQYASDAWSLAKRTAVGLNEIRKLINIETKFYDYTTTATSVPNTGVVASITQMAQGLTSTTRVGDSIRLQHMEVRGRFVINSAATTSLCRVMVVRDLDGYGTAPNVSDILEYTSSTLGPVSPYKFNKKQRFSILFDELLSLQGGAATDGMSSQVFTFSTAHQGHVLYLGSTGSAASDGKGTVYVAWISDEATNTPTVAFASRVLYTDD